MCTDTTWLSRLGAQNELYRTWFGACQIHTQLTDVIMGGDQLYQKHVQVTWMSLFRTQTWKPGGQPQPALKDARLGYLPSTRKPEHQDHQMVQKINHNNSGRIISVYILLIHLFYLTHLEERAKWEQDHNWDILLAGSFSKRLCWSLGTRKFIRVSSSVAGTEAVQLSLAISQFLY